MDYRLVGAVADYLDHRGLAGNYDQTTLAGGAIGVMSDQTFWQKAAIQSHSSNVQLGL